MRALLISLVLMGAVGCASFDSPFATSDEAKQVEGATTRSDWDREFWTKQAVFRYIRKGDEASRKAFVISLTDSVEGAVNVGGTAALIDKTMDRYVAKHALNNEDRLIVDYFRGKLTAELPIPDLQLPLTPERKRVVLVYVAAAREAVDEYLP